MSLALPFFKNYKFIYLFIFGCIGSSLLRGLSLVAASVGYFVVVHGLLIVVASLCCGARVLGTRASVVVARGLSSCGSRALERRLSRCGAWA